MSQAQTAPRIEHVNLTVSDLDRSIALFEDLMGWYLRIRAQHGTRGEFAHVGSDDNYLALWADGGDYSGQSKGKPMNHVGLQVPDLDAAEAQVKRHGLKTFSHSQYDPGPQSFYFLDWDGIEFEVVCYE